MRKSLLLLIALGLCSSLCAQKAVWQPAPGHLTLAIWPHGAPGAQPNPDGGDRHQRPLRVTPRADAGRELLCANLAHFALLHQGKRFQQGRDDGPKVA